MEVSEKAQEYLDMIKKREEIERQISALENELVRTVTSNPRARLVRNNYHITPGSATYIVKSIPIPGTNLCVIWNEEISDGNDQ